MLSRPLIFFILQIGYGLVLSAPTYYDPYGDFFADSSLFDSEEDKFEKMVELPPIDVYPVGEYIDDLEKMFVENDSPGELFTEYVRQAVEEEALEEAQQELAAEVELYKAVQALSSLYDSLKTHREEIEPRSETNTGISDVNTSDIWSELFHENIPSNDKQQHSDEAINKYNENKEPLYLLKRYADKYKDHALDEYEDLNKYIKSKDRQYSTNDFFKPDKQPISRDVEEINFETLDGWNKGKDEVSEKNEIDELNTEYEKMTKLISTNDYDTDRSLKNELKKSNMKRKQMKESFNHQFSKSSKLDTSANNIYQDQYVQILAMEADPEQNIQISDMDSEPEQVLERVLSDAQKELKEEANNIRENRLDGIMKINQPLENIDLEINNKDQDVQVITLDQLYEPRFGRKLNEFNYNSNLEKARYEKHMDDLEMQQDAPVPVDEHVEMKKLTNVERGRPSNERYALIDGFISELDKEIGNKQTIPHGYASPNLNSNTNSHVTTTTEKSFWRRVGETFGLAKKNK